MSWHSFSKELSIVSVLIFILGILFSGIGKNQPILWIYILGMATFVLISLIIFLYAYNTSSSDNLFSFNNVVVASFIFKLLLSIVVIMLYERTFQVKGKVHLFHFILVYLIYTAYEVYFLTKLARSSE